jgi:hypothetical protein
MSAQKCGHVPANVRPIALFSDLQKDVNANSEPCQALNTAHIDEEANMIPRSWLPLRFLLLALHDRAIATSPCMGYYAGLAHIISLDSRVICSQADVHRQNAPRLSQLQLTAGCRSLSPATALPGHATEVATVCLTPRLKAVPLRPTRTMSAATTYQQAELAITEAIPLFRCRQLHKERILEVQSCTHQ